MRKKRLSSRDMHLAFATAGEMLALMCRLRGIEAEDLPASDVDAILDMALEEASCLAPARCDARRPRVP
jgi:hypothetical protein